MDSTIKERLIHIQSDDEPVLYFIHTDGKIFV